MGIEEALDRVEDQVNKLTGLLTEKTWSDAARQAAAAARQASERASNASDAAAGKSGKKPSGGRCG